MFIYCEPLTGQCHWWQHLILCHIEVTSQRAMPDFARFMQRLDNQYWQAALTRVVLDNLNTHSAKSIYEAFKPAQARRLARRFEFHYTPKHGSWLNMAEIELPALYKVCLNRRIADEDILNYETAAYEHNRNERHALFGGASPPQMRA